ncbi:hypothetical protein [Wolbachia endosymbiont (group A) of Merzomyia westermanni]|uniref:hypothetical protein n=1 Tax=Wolbachia endosymbiont (group A) of Merzomyia westermanni TaxID=2954031 RepID=UPI00223289B9|nr:hypothetical protein [Wolbachia endosymbiont (group A) of Merzomyia westermanni]
MPNRETVRALVSAFNVHNYARNTVKTNFTLQSRGKEDYIVVSFDKSMGTYQCRRYLDSIKRKIIREFYGIEKGNKAEILDTAKLIFDVNSFPFENYKDVESFPLKNYKGDWFVDKQGSIKFVTSVDDGVIFNLKSHLASSLAKDIREDMQISSTTVPFNKGKYLCCSKFDNKELSQQFKSKFLSRMRERYENVPKKPLKVKDNSVYIKDVFDDARFIDSVTRYKAWLVGMYLGVESSANYKVKLFKDMIIESIGQATRVTVAGFIRNFPLNEKTAKILIPVVLDNGEPRILESEEALKLSYAFNYAVFNNLYSKVQAELPICGDSGIYGIDFSNKEISHCVITKIIKNSVINKDHELSIDPELRFRALSRSPSTELSGMKLESPTCSQGGVKDSPRQGSEKEEGEEGLRLLNYVNSVRTSDRPLTDLSYATTSCGVPGISRDLSAGEGTLTEANIPDQKRSSSIPSFRAWDSSTFLNSEDSLKDTENICNEEPEKQQVTDESDRKSSDECSKAKPQDSKSPEKKHGDGLLCSNSSIGSMWSKLKGNVLPSLKRNNKGRGSVYSISSSVSAPGGSVPEKLPVSESSSSFPGRIKAKSNPPSAVTSPTHEGVPEWQQRLNPDQREELRPFLSPEERKKLNSNYFSPGEEWHLYLTRTLSGKRELSRFLCESEESQLRRLAEAQLSSPDNSSSKKVDRDSGFCSMGFPAVQHKGSVPSEVKECEVEPVSEALRK